MEMKRARKSSCVGAAFALSAVIFTQSACTAIAQENKNDPSEDASSDTFVTLRLGSDGTVQIVKIGDKNGKPRTNACVVQNNQLEHEVKPASKTAARDAYKAELPPCKSIKLNMVLGVKSVPFTIIRSEGSVCDTWIMDNVFYDYPFGCSLNQ